MRRIPTFISLIFFLLLCFLIGCDNNEDVKKVDLTKTEKVNEFPKKSRIIRIGLVPVEDIRRMAAKFEPLKKYLNKKIGLKVELVYLDSYSEICDRFIYNELEAAFFGSFSYALTHSKAGIEPVARPDFNGSFTYRGLIVVRKDSNIKSIKDMQGKRLALVNEATYAGYLYPLYYFYENGIKDLEKYFSKVLFTDRHDKAIFSVLEGEADIATPKDSVFETFIKENPHLQEELVILSASGSVPTNTLCVSKSFDPVLKNELRDILLNLKNDAEAKFVLKALEAKEFIETKDEDYHNIYEMTKALKINLDTYPYYNGM